MKRVARRVLRRLSYRHDEDNDDDGDTGSITSSSSRYSVDKAHLYVLQVSIQKDLISLLPSKLL